MLPYYLSTQIPLPIIEHEQEVCERVFSALCELKILFDPATQPDIEDHVAIKNLGVRIAELALQVHDGLLECLKIEKNTVYPRVVLIPMWTVVHDMFCQFAVDWCAKYSIYEHRCQEERKKRSRARKEDKLLKGYIKCINDSEFIFYKMYRDPDTPLLCDTVLKNLVRAGVQMCAAEKYVSLSDQYNCSVQMAINDAISILAYGIQCFVGMLVGLDKKSEALWELNETGESSLLRQYERYKDRYGEEIFFELLRTFDPSANEGNLPHVTKNQWKGYSEKKLAELMGTSIGREGIKGLNTYDAQFSNDELEKALRECLCDMDEFYAFMKRYYQFEISRRAYLTMREWEAEDMERISALDFYAQIKSKSQKEDLGTKKTSRRRNRELKITPDTYTYKWLTTEENRIARLFQILQNNARWIAPDESPDNFYALFKGDPKEFHIRWCGTKQHLFHLFKVIFERGLVTWGRKNGQWLILQSHFKNKQGHEFSSFNGEKESIKAKKAIEMIVDILDPSVENIFAEC